MRISQLIAKAEDVVIERAPKVQDSVKRGASRAALHLSFASFKVATRLSRAATKLAPVPQQR